MDKEPPVGTPKWALNEGWKGRLEQREEEEAQKYI